jgi:hypothetical protein
MPKFSKEDFTTENAIRLSVITMKRMELKPLTDFRDLPESQKKKFNRLMNEYIANLGEDWETKILDDFNLIVNEDILTEEFNPSTQMVRELNTDIQILLTDEQKEFLEKVKEEKGEETIIY